MGVRDTIARFLTLRGAQKSDPGFLYHATNADRAREIAQTGAMTRYKPHEFTDQNVWPDGSTERRNYFTPTAQNTWQFAPEEGNPVLLRTPQEGHPFKTEKGTGDIYSTKDVPATRIEALSESGWVPLNKDMLGVLTATGAVGAMGSTYDQNQYEAPP